MPADILSKIFLKAIEMEKDVFAAQALMLQYNSPELVDSAGDYFCGLGVAFSAGKDKKASLYNKKKDIFSACAGAAIYRRKIFEEIGYFEEEFFAYLEDDGYMLSGKNVFATVIFLCRMQKCCMWEVLPAGQDIMNSR